MIICGHSKVEKSKEKWKVRIDKKIGSSLGFFVGQTLFGARDEFNRLFLSSLRLNPHVNYFRVFMEDVRGSLAKITELFSKKGINILSGGAFGFGNIWASEFIADFKDVEASPEEMVGDIESLGGYVTLREITELFPRAFELNEALVIESDGPNDMHLLLSELPDEDANYAVFKAWPRVQALFVDFYTPGNKLLKIYAKIMDIPGSLNKLANLLKTQVNLIAIDERHHDEESGEWNIYGVLEIGSLSELHEQAVKSSIVLEFDVEPLGWKG